MRNTHKVMTVFVLLSIILALNAPQVQHGHAADGTTGTLTASNDNYYLNSAITLTMEGLTVSGDYSLNFTIGCYPGATADAAGGDDRYSFTLSATETKKVLTFEDMRAPTAGGRVCKVELTYQSAGTLIDSVDLKINDPAEGLPVAFILGLAIPVIIFLVVIGIVKKF